MKEIRFHGRGGQGAVTAASLLAVAGFRDGKFTQAFPTFGVERRGAPVAAFTRISDEFIRIRTNVYKPDVLVVLDPTLFAVVDIPSGLKPCGMIIINTERKPGDFDLGEADVRCIDATKEAFDVLGRDIVNTAMLGAFAGFTGEISKDSIIHAVREHFPTKLAESNVKLVERVYDLAKKQ